MNDTAKNNLVHPQTVEVPQPLEVHPSVTPLAAELLMKVCEIIALHPESYNQGDYGNKCGSPCCILGHAAVQVGVRPMFNGSCHDYPHNPEDLGLTPEQYGSIYWVAEWPNQFQTGSWNVPVPTAVARIEHFLRTGE